LPHAPILTGLAPDPQQPGYRLVEVDRGRFASLPGDALELLRLELGRALPAPTLARLQELADIEAACRAALRALARRSHARQDLKRKLVRNNTPRGQWTKRYGGSRCAGSSTTGASPASTPRCGPPAVAARRD